MTNIEWTEQTWNATTGCDRISPGCDHCYALTMAKRLKGMGQAKYQTDGNPKTSGPGFGFATHSDAIREPLRWKKPRRVFVNSMSDVFHDANPTANLHLIFGVMAATPQHTYQILTKRHGRMRSLLNDPQFAHMTRHRAEQAFGRSATASWTWPLPNVHLGVSVEDQKWANIRIPALAQTPAAVRFLSCEPLLGPVRLPLTEPLDACTCGGYGPPYDMHEPSCGYEPGAAYNIDWVIIGGESGPGARPFNPQWAADLIEDARSAGAAPFVKQLGSVWARDWTVNGKTVAAHGDTKGGNPDYWPTHLRVREYPKAAASD
ncbi:phage Gp37/Gp68 family protein [Streptomyces sp. NPDC004783]|uniref:phage Gp37/Gp68 family protein n=1 Tax=Streptomyces sp. NPDC004783 TaxID=3154459 RepID=UPI0033BCD459